MALTDKVVKEINESIVKGEKMVREVEHDLNEARRAGVDVTEQSSEVKKQKERLRMLKGVYGAKNKGL